MTCKDLKVKNGQVFLTNVKGKITIIEELEPHYTKPGNRRIRKFLCDCEIGGIKEIALWKIREYEKGLARERNSWDHMIDRCNNPKNDRYYDYGGRGIKVCNRWLKFKNFYTDMGNRPKDKTLDRIDVNGNYTPENCRWATREQQYSNMRSNIFLEYNGEKLTLSQWSKKINKNRSVLRSRMKRGWSVKQILLTPINNKYKNK